MDIDLERYVPNDILRARLAALLARREEEHERRRRLVLALADKLATASEHLTRLAERRRGEK